MAIETVELDVAVHRATVTLYGPAAPRPARQRMRGTSEAGPLKILVGWLIFRWTRHPPQLCGMGPAPADFPPAGLGDLTET
jgi:hypothetical protein